ncbi:hypothetical protein GCM10020331_077210 [Ectobacillus funiculus]
MLLWYVSRWYRTELTSGTMRVKKRAAAGNGEGKLSRQVKLAVVFLIFLTFARSWYNAGIGNFYQFYLIEHYGLSIRAAQYYVFIFMIAGVVGTFFWRTVIRSFWKAKSYPVFHARFRAACFVIAAYSARLGSAFICCSWIYFIQQL